MLDSDPEEDPVEPPRKPPRQLSPTPPPQPVRRPCPEAPEPPKPPAKNWGTLLTKMKPDAPKKALKRAPPPTPKPKPPAPPATAGKRAWLSRDDWLAKRRREEAPDDGFDIRAHGYWRTKAGLVYRCPDGRELPATGVDAFWP